MLNSPFFEYANKKILEGQHYFSSGLKLMVQSMDEKIFDLLDQNNDEIFTNPMLFAFLNSDGNKINLEQILYGSIHKQIRPKLISVLSNKNGEIYLPTFGYIKLDIMKVQRYDLITNTKNNEITILNGNTLIPHTIKTNPTIQDTNIEIQCISNCLTDNYAPKSYLNSTRTQFCSNPKKIEDINQACQILRDNYPAFYDLFLIVTKWIFPFTHSKSNSFATLSMHGVGFINTFKCTGTVFYLEDIVHQCGHIIFSSLTYKPQEYFCINPDTPMKEFLKDEDRSLYVLFHGVFTEGLMCEAFDYCIKNKVFNSRKEHELKGRFSYILLRFLLDMEILENFNYFSEVGQMIYNDLYQSMLDKYKRYGYLLSSYDLTNQPYNFDYNKFILRNKIA